MNILPTLTDQDLKAMTIDDFWTKKGITKPGHTPSLMEMSNLDPNFSNHRRAAEYHSACRKYLNGELGDDSWTKWRHIVSQIGRKRSLGDKQ